MATGKDSEVKEGFFPSSRGCGEAGEESALRHKTEKTDSPGKNRPRNDSFGCLSAPGEVVP